LEEMLWEAALKLEALIGELTRFEAALNFEAASTAELAGFPHAPTPSSGGSGKCKKDIRQNIFCRYEHHKLDCT
jgi:hypothetical protein